MLAASVIVTHPNSAMLMLCLTMYIVCTLLEASVWSAKECSFRYNTEALRVTVATIILKMN